MGKIGKIFLVLVIAAVPWILAINILRVMAGGTQLYTYTILQELSKVNISFYRTVSTILRTFHVLPSLSAIPELFSFTGDFFTDVGLFFQGCLDFLIAIFNAIFLMLRLVVYLPLDLFDFAYSVAEFFYFLVGFDFGWHWQA